MAGFSCATMSGRNWMFMHTSKPNGEVVPQQIFRRWGIDDNKLAYLAISTEVDEKTNQKYSLGWLQTRTVLNDGAIRAFFPEGFITLSVTDTSGKEDDNEKFCKLIPKNGTTYVAFGSYQAIATGPLINSGDLPENVGIQELNYLSESEDNWSDSDDDDKDQTGGGLGDLHGNYDDMKAEDNEQ